MLYLALDNGKEKVEHLWAGTRQKLINISREEPVINDPVLGSYLYFLSLVTKFPPIIFSSLFV